MEKLENGSLEAAITHLNTYTDTIVKIMSAMGDDSKAQIDALAKELTKEYAPHNGEAAKETI